VRLSRLVALLITLALASVVGGCASGSISQSAAPPASGATPSTVDVKLQEWAVLPASPTVKAGSVTFKVANVGPDWNHELVVVKTDLALDALPTKAGGSFDEAGAGVTINGEADNVAVGGSASLTLDLAPGKYVLLCNIIEDIRIHYRLGMRTSFEVTQ
jgi:uncharacterized cupredoxin-like copper-binding protein